MLPTVYLAAVAVPLLLAVVAVGLRLAAGVATRIDRAVVPERPLADVAELVPAAGDHDLAELPQIVAPPPAVPAVPLAPSGDVVRPGPLQLVDEAEPSTKRCPDCAETVLASARVCKHCHYRFAPPLQGSWAV